MFEVFHMQEKNRNTAVSVAVHLLIWGVVFNLPMLSSNPPKNIVASWIPPTAFAIIFYNNYFLLIPRLLFNKKTGWFVAANILVYILLMFLVEHWLRNYVTSPTDTEHHHPEGFDLYLRIFISYVLVTGASVAIRITGEWFRSEEIRRELEREHLRSELLNLKNQLNPHFFFNTLNTIYGLISLNQPLAQDAIHRLSKLMRYHLYDSNERFVPLKKEIDFVHHYIDLMKLRMTPNVRIEYHFSELRTDMAVAPLLFIPLIENAFKHGVDLQHPSHITMHMQVDDQRKLTFNIENTAYPKQDNDRSGSGIGLENLRKRLALLYPDHYSLDIKEAGNLFIATLTLQL